MIKKPLYKPRRHTGFTLAEVLITLGVIGVVCAMTIPTLMKNTQDAEFKTAYKKAYSIANQALLSAGQQELLVSREAATRAADEMTNFVAFKSQFKVIKDCNSGDNSACWVAGDTFFSNPLSAYPAFVDGSGMSWSMYDVGAWDGLMVDTNGFKKPNLFGQDRFYFYLFDANNNGNLGIPIKILPYYDLPSYNADTCKAGNSHPCYYESWLKG